MGARAGIHIHVSCSAPARESGGMDGSVEATLYLSWVPEGQDPGDPANRRHIEVPFYGKETSPTGVGDDAITMAEAIARALHQSGAPTHRIGTNESKGFQRDKNTGKLKPVTQTNAFVEFDDVESLDFACCDDQGKVRWDFYGNVKEEPHAPKARHMGGPVEVYSAVKLIFGRKPTPPKCPKLKEPGDVVPGPYSQTEFLEAARNAVRLPEPPPPPPPIVTPVPWPGPGEDPTPPPPPPYSPPPVAEPRYSFGSPGHVPPASWHGIALPMVGLPLAQGDTLGILHLGFGSYPGASVATWEYVPWRILWTSPLDQVLHVLRCLQAARVDAVCDGHSIAILSDTQTHGRLVALRLTVNTSSRGFPWGWTFDLWPVHTRAQYETMGVSTGPPDRLGTSAPPPARVAGPVLQPPGGLGSMGGPGQQLTTSKPHPGPLDAVSGSGDFGLAEPPSGQPLSPSDHGERGLRGE